MEQFLKQFMGWKDVGGSELSIIAIVILVILSIWSLAWKGWALWKSARADTAYSKYWFIALLLINTAGIFEILYLFVFSKMKGSVADNKVDSQNENNRQEK